MRVNSLLVVKVLAGIGTNVAFVWSFIEFVLYLAKDKIFNWWSVWVFLICVTIAIGTVVYSGFKAIKNRNKSLRKLKQMRENKPKSKFRQRLDQAMNEANTKA